MTHTCTSISTWSPVVAQIRDGSGSAVEELYGSLRSIHLFFRREIGWDRADDAYHNLIIYLVRVIKSGAIRQPEALPAYAMTTARRMVYEDIREVIRARYNQGAADLALVAPTQSPEQLASLSERESIARRVLTALPPRSQEILIRFYLNEESEEKIRATMGITGNQFRIIKSRAKQRYEHLVFQALNRTARKPVLSASQASREAIA